MDVTTQGQLGAHRDTSQASAIPGLVIFGLGTLVLLGWAGLSISLMLSSAHATGVLLGVLFVFLFPLGTYLALYGWRRRLLRVELYDGGFCHVDRRGKIVVPWQGVASVRVKLEESAGLLGKRVTGQFRVLTAYGREIVIDESLPHHVRIGSEISERAQAALLPGYQHALAHGQRVEFGPWSMDNTALFVNGRALSWASIDAVRWERLIFDGSYAIYANGATLASARVGSAEIPNPTIFVTLLAGFGKLDAPKETIVAELFDLLSEVTRAAA